MLKRGNPNDGLSKNNNTCEYTPAAYKLYNYVHHNIGLIVHNRIYAMFEIMTTTPDVISNKKVTSGITIIINITALHSLLTEDDSWLFNRYLSVYMFTSKYFI